MITISLEKTALAMIKLLLKNIVGFSLYKNPFFPCLTLLIFFLFCSGPYKTIGCDSCFAGTLNIVKTKDYENGPEKGISNQKSFSEYSIQELKMFGVVMVPQNAYVQDKYRGINFLATPKSKYTKQQLTLLKFFIDRTPAVLLDPGPSAIVTYGSQEIRFPPGSSVLSLAMASGPYVFFDTSTFNTTGIFSAGSIEGIFRAFLHELVHVLQFHRAAASINRKKALARFNNRGIQVLWNQVVLKTSLIKSFVDVTGWSWKERAHSIMVLLDNFDQEQTSRYGKANILEDMAETVSLVTIGDLTQLSKARIDWAVNLLGFPSLRAALFSTFPYSTLYKPIKLHSASVTKFDTSMKTAFKNKYTFVDLEYFINETKRSYPKIVRHIQKAFIQRGWNKKFSKTVNLPHGVIKRIMAFDGRWRDVYLEVITYDFARDYILKPSGTIITVLSGYKIPKK